jgi:hypothetical protein
MWHMINESHEKGYCMALSARPFHGLKNEFAYSIMNTAIISGSEKLINFRVPCWIDFDWKGDWSKQSDKWFSELKNQYKTDDEKCVWMAWRDIYKYFKSVSISKIENEYAFSNKKTSNFLEGKAD